MSAFRGDCPNCGAQWDYESDGHVYSRLIGIYSRERDRTVAWRCPDCAKEWARDDTAVLLAGGRDDQETPE